MADNKMELDKLVQKYLKSKPLNDNDAIAARREYARRRRQALREKNGKPCRKPVLSPEEIKEAREIYEWLKSLRDSETCRQSVSSGRRVNIQMRYLKAAWEAHKREVHQQ